LPQQIAQRVEVAFGLRHLLAFDKKEAHMEPMPREGVVSCGFALGDFVLVVREHQVFAAGVQIEAVTEKFHGHCRALDVPSRPAFTEWRLPGGFARLGCLPQREVAHGVLLVFVGIHACAVFNAFEVFLGKLAVLRKTRNAEIPAAVFGLVGDVLCCKPLNQRDHVRNILCGQRDCFRALNAECVGILKKSLRIFRGVLADRHIRSRCIADDLVIHVRHIHHVAHADAVQLNYAPQHVYMQKRAEVADVAEVINGGAAAIEAQGFAIAGVERFDFSGQGVEEFEGHARFRSLSGLWLFRF